MKLIKLYHQMTCHLFTGEDVESTGGTRENLTGSKTRNQCYFFIAFILTLIVSLAIVSFVIFLISKYSKQWFLKIWDYGGELCWNVSCYLITSYCCICMTKVFSEVWAVGPWYRSTGLCSLCYKAQLCSLCRGFVSLNSCQELSSAVWRCVPENSNIKLNF